MSCTAQQAPVSSLSQLQQQRRRAAGAGRLAGRRAQRVAQNTAAAQSARRQQQQPWTTHQVQLRRLRLVPLPLLLASQAGPNAASRRRRPPLLALVLT